MTPEVELRHIESGVSPGERPLGLLTEFNAVSSGRSRELLAKAREVMQAVVANSDPWPDIDAWRQRLPGWFIERSAPEETKEQAGRWLAWWRTLPPDEKARATEERGWSLADWLYWLEPSQRQWFWWDGHVIDADTARVVVEARDNPTALGALQWLLKASGAERVAEVDHAA